MLVFRYFVRNGRLGVNIQGDSFYESVFLISHANMYSIQEMVFAMCTHAANATIQQVFCTATSIPMRAVFLENALICFREIDFIETNWNFIHSNSNRLII